MELSIWRRGKGRIDIDLQMWGHPDLGVLLIYSKWGGGLKLTYTSKGDLTRLRAMTLRCPWASSYRSSRLGRP